MSVCVTISSLSDLASDVYRQESHPVSMKLRFTTSKTNFYPDPTILDIQSVYCKVTQKYWFDFSLNMGTYGLGASGHPNELMVFLFPYGRFRLAVAEQLIIDLK